MSAGRWTLTVIWLSGALVVVCFVADGVRHAMPWAYAPTLIGFCVIGAACFFRKQLWSLLAIVASIVVLALVLGRWEVPLRPAAAASQASRQFPLLGPHPYCYAGDRQDFFGLIYACYPHHVVPGKITNAESNEAVAFKVDNSHIVDVYP